MTVSEPEDSDEIFRRLTEDLDVDVELVGLVVVSSLTDFELVEKFNHARRELHARGEIRTPTTATGRDIHSEYHACLLEMKKRGLA